jgi:hypothetical protein
VTGEEEHRETRANNDETTAEDIDDGDGSQRATPAPVGKRPTMVNFIMRPTTMVLNFMKMMATT